MLSVLSRWLPRIAAALLVCAACPVAAQEPTATPPLLPDAKLTPGDTLDVTLADIRETGYSARVRNVPVSVKREVYASYGIQTWGRGEYEIDHLIPLSIGGSNSKRNLWPQSYLTQPWNARVKDRLEYRLLALVRSGKVDLHTAQTEIASDWIAAYKKYVGPEPRPRGGQRRASGLRTAEEAGTGRSAGDAAAFRDEAPDTETAPAVPATTTGSPAAAPAGGTDQVWVNTKSHVIWKPGSAYYGKTERGQYMTEQEALQAGNHLAHGTGN